MVKVGSALLNKGYQLSRRVLQETSNDKKQAIPLVKGGGRGSSYFYIIASTSGSARLLWQVCVRRVSNLLFTYYRCILIKGNSPVSNYICVVPGLHFRVSICHSPAEISFLKISVGRCSGVLPQALTL